MTREMARFVLTGVVNTAAGISAIAFAQLVLGLGPYWSNAFGYGIGLACSYALNSRWTFRVGPGSAVRIMRFVLAFALAYGTNLAVLHWLVLAQAPWLVVQATALIVYTVLFFLLCRFVVFRRPADAQPASGPRMQAPR